MRTGIDRQLPSHQIECVVSTDIQVDNQQPGMLNHTRPQCLKQITFCFLFFHGVLRELAHVHIGKIVQGQCDIHRIIHACGHRRIVPT